MNLAGFTAQFDRAHIIALNRAAETEKYDLVSISSAFYPLVADRYAILAVGSSVGRGYGPVLASKQPHTCESLRGKRIAVAGAATTGGALAAMYCPNAELIEMPYDRIADAVAADACDAGVMIHEELLYFPQKGLQCVCNLGATWTEDTRLPLPVGLNVVHRRWGRERAEEVARTCRWSLQWGLDHFDEAFAFADRFGRGCGRQHIAMFSNDDTLRLADDVRTALRVWFDRLAWLGLAPVLGEVEVIDG